MQIVCVVLWLNGTLYEVGDGAVETVGYGDDELLYAVNSNHVSICSGLAAILNAVSLSAAIIYVRRITIFYPSVDCSVRYNSVTITCVGLHSLGNCLYSTTGSRTLAFGYMRYGRLTLISES